MTGVAAWTRRSDGAIGSPDGPVGQDATRYLCVAAHLDPDFTRKVVRELLVAEHRLPLPVPSVDLATVARHSLAARSRRFYRDTVIAAAVLLAVAAAGWAIAAWYVWGAGLWLACRAARHGSARHAAVFGALLWGFGGLVLLTLVASTADPLGLRAATAIPVPSGARPALVWIGTPAAVVLCCWLAVFADEIAAHATVADRLRRDRFTPGRWLSAEPAWAQHALGVLGERLADKRLEHHPVLDPADPFLGAGRQASRRRWLIELGSAGTRSAPFDTEDLLDRVCERLAGGFGGLDRAEASGARSVTIDQCAISTADALATRDGRDSVRLLPDAPGGGGPGRGPRPFRRIRVGADPAGTRVTVFLSASAGAGLLQVELYGHVLGPIPARYRAADHASPFGPAVVLGGAVRAVKRLPDAIFGAPRALARTAADPALRRRNRAALLRAAASGHPLRAGARFCLREAVADPVGTDRFADEDANLYLAVVERRVREELRPLMPSATAEF